jgi:hypothetical protein
MRRLAWSLVFLGVSSAYAQTHEHGKGTLFVAQDGTKWQLQFTLPAGDVLGFEHAPETAEQESIVHEKLAQLNEVSSVFTLPKGCTLDSIDVHEPSFLAMGSDHEEHDEHELDDHHDDHDEEHEHDEHHDDHDHDHDEHADEQHGDFEASYILDCSAGLKQVTLTLFDMAPALESVDVEWAIETSQGSTVLSPSSNVLTLK